jgi:predicted ATPase
MKIRKVQFKNGYKRFFDLTIDLGEHPKRIVALVGPNGCGKSSVLDGMLFHANAHGQIGSANAKDFEYHSMNRVPNFNHTNVVIEFLEGSYGELRTQRAATGKEQTIFSFRSPYRYNSSLKVTESKATGEIRLNNYGATTSSDLDAKMEENFRRLNIKYNKYQKTNDCKPSEAKKAIIGDLNVSIQKCLDLEIFDIGDIEDSKGTLYFKKKGHPVEFEFNVLSSGEKEVVDILLDLYLRQDEYNETIFLLDEPELHINTAIQKNLLIEINRLIGENCQLWVTTHSIGFLRALQEIFKDQCQIIRFKENVDFAATSQTLTPVIKTFAMWKEIFEVALDDLAHLVSPKQIIYCEGKDTPGRNGLERGLDAQVYNNIFSEKHHETLFISSGGNTELDQRSEVGLAILTKIFSSIEILVLKDRDISSGKVTSQNDRNLYLRSNPPNHRVLKRWEIENYLYDKEVLKKYCSTNSLTFDEVNYDIFVKNIEDQNLKDETGRIKNICGITTNVNPEQFKLALSSFVSEDMAVYLELENCIFPKT